MHGRLSVLPETIQERPRRHDFSLEPPQDTMLDVLKEAEYDVIGVGKINDIFARKRHYRVCADAGLMQMALKRH